MARQAHPKLIEAPEVKELPALELLHKRHYGLDGNRCRALADTARVCLARSGTSPTLFKVTDDVGGESRLLRWKKPNRRLQAVYANTREVTEDSAYIVCLSAVEARLGLVACRRADEPSGADYYIGPPDRQEDGTDNFEDLVRLEVSGTSEGDETDVQRRLREKVNQAARGVSPLPAFAGIVGFRARRIAFARVEVPNGEH